VTQSTPSGCDSCNKSSLSLLILRPGPIAIKDPLAPVGSSAVETAANLTADLMPAQKPAQSRTVLRLLRAGFIYIYLKTPPAGVGNWLIYQITDNGDVISSKSPSFNPKDPPPPCGKRDVHNSAGFKLVEIPQAHKISTLWIAFSANLWTEKIKARNAANPAVMQEVNLKSASNPNTFKPTTDALRKKVLEFALGRLTYKGEQTGNHDFPFHALSERCEAVAKTLRDAAAKNPETEGKELAVVIRDPVAYATELNALRLRQHDIAEAYLAAPERRQPVEVNKIINILKHNLLLSASDDELAKAAPLQDKAAFDKSKYPPGTTWQALTLEEKSAISKELEKSGNFLSRAIASRTFMADTVGRVIYPDFEERLAKLAKEKAERDWEDFQDYYDEVARSKWEADFTESFDKIHTARVRELEADWVASLTDSHYREYFQRHYDENQSLLPEQVAKHGGFCSGSSYTQEVWISHTPAPFTDVGGDLFEKQLVAEAEKPDAVLVRALMGNQAGLWETLEDSKRDKTYDFMKGLIGEFTATGKVGTAAAPKLTKIVTWLTDFNMGFCLGIVGALVSTAARAIANSAPTRANPLVNPAAIKGMTRAGALLSIYQACENALLAKTGVVKVPVFLTATVDLATLVKLRKSRGQPISKRDLRNLPRNGKVTIGIMTDTETLSTLKSTSGDALQDIAKSSGQNIQIRESVISFRDSIASGTAPAGMTTISLERFAPLYENAILAGANAPSTAIDHIKRLYINAADSIASLNGRLAGKSLRAAAMTFEGRLAIGTMIVQGVGFCSGLKAYGQAKDPQAKTDAMLSIGDGAAGVVGGLAEFGLKWTEIRMGEHAAQQTLRYSAMRFVAPASGIAGAVLNAIMSWRAAGTLDQSGNKGLAVAMKISAALFYGSSVSSILMASHAVLVMAIKRGVTNAAVIGTERWLARVVGYRIATRIVLGRLGTAAVGLTVPGIGWAVTITAVADTIYVVIATPTALQTWLKLCYFGKPGMFDEKRKSWTEEEAAWKDLQEESSK
jgi:hypothetical protein